MGRLTGHCLSKNLKVMHLRQVGMMRFPITPSNIYDIPRLKTSKKFLQLIDFTAVHRGSGEPIHVDVRSWTNYHPQESFVQTLSQFIDDNQPNKKLVAIHNQCPGLFCHLYEYIHSLHRSRWNFHHLIMSVIK